MKVIGRVGATDYLVQASIEEIAVLADKKITHPEEINWIRIEAVKVGTSFDVKSAFHQIHRNDSRKRDVEMVRQSLKGILANLDMLEPFLDEPELPSEQKSE